jgi:hypothetical protein
MSSTSDVRGLYRCFVDNMKLLVHITRAGAVGGDFVADSWAGGEHRGVKSGDFAGDLWVGGEPRRVKRSKWDVWYIAMWNPCVCI